MSIDFIGTLPPHNGGSAIVNCGLLTGLAARGHRIRAIAPMTPEASSHGDRLARAYPEINLTRIEVPHFHTSPDFRADDAYMQQQSHGVSTALKRFLSARIPDVIIVGRETFLGDVLELAGDRIPSVALLHGGTVWGIIRGSLPDELAGQILHGFRKARLCVSVAKHMATSLRSAGVECRVIENTIDTEAFHPMTRNEDLLRKHDIDADRTIVAHISNMKALKRPLDVVYSAKEALRWNPCLVYLVIGDGIQLADMQRACVECGIREHFRFTGWVDYGEMPQYVNLADMVIMPSEMEARALVYLEAQACGRLLIASDIPAAREVVADGRTGLLYQTGDIAALTNRTLLAAASPARREEIGYKARQQAEKRSLTRFLESYESVLLEAAT